MWWIMLIGFQALNQPYILRINGIVFFKYAELSLFIFLSESFASLFIGSY